MSLLKALKFSHVNLNYWFLSSDMLNCKFESFYWKINYSVSADFMYLVQKWQNSRIWLSSWVMKILIFWPLISKCWITYGFAWGKIGRKEKKIQFWPYGFIFQERLVSLTKSLLRLVVDEQWWFVPCSQAFSLIMIVKWTCQDFPTVCHSLVWEGNC